MAEPVWGQLDKAQDDNEIIEEAIARLLVAHNDDANAHIGAGKSLNTHKTQEIVDHPAASVITDKIGDGEVTNPKLLEKVRVYTAIVDAAGNYDFTTIQAAINYVEGLGIGGAILIKAGTYTITTELLISTPNISLIGEGETTIVIAGGAYADNTLLTISDTPNHLEQIFISKIKFDGNDEANVNYGIYVEDNDRLKITDCYIENVSVANAAGIALNTCGNAYLSDNYIKDCDKGIIIYENSSLNRTFRNVIEGGSIGIELLLTIDNTIFANFLIVQSTKGIYCNGNAVFRNSILFNKISDPTINLVIGIHEDNTAAANTYIGNDIVGAATNMLCLGYLTRAAKNWGADVGHSRNWVLMKNTSGAQRVRGDVVILKSVAAGNEVTTTGNSGDDNVFGMVLETIANNGLGAILILGKTVDLKVNGFTNIAIGDFLGTHSDAGISMKAAAKDMAFAVALEAYANNDSNGVIDALLITPRKI